MIHFLLALLFISTAFAAGLVSEIRNPHEVLIDLFDERLLERDKVLIVSRKANKAVAFGYIRHIDRDVSPNEAVVEISEIIDNSMVMKKDLVYPVDFQLLKEKNVPGFTSLTLRGDHHIPAQYKELAYFGVFTSEGHPLDKGEFLVSPFQLQYGAFEDLSAKMVNALWLDGYANAGLKYQVMRNKYAKVTMNTLGAYKIQSRDYIWQVGGVITLPANAKFQSHLMANISLDPQFADAHATKGLGLFQDSDIRSITEYITSDWNRVLYGPVYNVELQTFGGTVSYMWIWHSFHMSLGLGTKDFSNLKFSKKGYYYVYDFFWRF